MWMTAHPLRQLPTLVEAHYVGALEKHNMTLERLSDMSSAVRSPFVPLFLLF